MRQTSEIGVGLLGLGVVGSGVARMLAEKSAQISRLTGGPVVLKQALVRDPSKQRDFQPPQEIVTSRAEDVLDSPGIDIIVEVMGGQNPALDLILRAVSLGKHVVTANKEVMARHGLDILDGANKAGIHVRFEASVGGGIPVIGPLMRDLLANDVTGIHAIINGTTNYILTEMSRSGADFDDALRDAQRLGYAEADPADDIEGTDAAYKLTILSTLAFQARFKESDVYREGITRLTARDFLYARELGYAVKLMALARKVDGCVQLRIHPALVPTSAAMARVDGVFNAVQIETDLAGPILLHGRGAGSYPTASAVLADVLHIAQSIRGGVGPQETFSLSDNIRVTPMSELETMYYLRLNVADRSGVFARIATILGQLDISIASVIQKGVDRKAAEVVLMTHRAREESMQEAIRRLEALDVVHEFGNMIRVEELEN